MIIIPFNLIVDTKTESSDTRSRNALSGRPIVPCCCHFADDKNVGIQGFDFMIKTIRNKSIFVITIHIINVSV